MNDSFNTAMGRAIRELRKTNGLSQTDVGTALGVTYQQIHKYESGSNGLGAHYLPKLAALFGTTVADIYERAGIVTDIPEPSPADNDSFLAARYVGKISDPKLRGLVVDFARKAAYQGAAA